MVSSSSTSNKAIFTAIPLIQSAKSDSTEPLLSAAEQSANNDINNNNETLTEAHCEKKSHFLAGGLMGVLCYFVVHALVLPVLPHMKNAFVESAFSALLWSGITTISAYGLWFAFIVALRQCRSDGNDDGDFWEDMEFSYAVGVFLGFSASCIVSLARAGVPWFFVLLVVVSALLWTRVMSWMAHRAGTKATKTVLPMVVV